MRIHPRSCITALPIALGLIVSGLIALGLTPTSADDWPMPAVLAANDLMLGDAGTGPYPLPHASVSWHLDDVAIACDSPGWAAGSQGLSYSPGYPGKPRRDQPGDLDRGDCPPYRYGMSDCERAGRPHQVAWWAAPSVDKHYSAWFVGGGAAFGGRGRRPSEGTWGMDYQGPLPFRRVWLQWTCGRPQGGEGAYQTDGHTGPLSRH
jgi:hypothetical protein